MSMNRRLIFHVVAGSCAALVAVAAGEPFAGRYFQGEGDVDYLQKLDISRRMYGADAEFQNLSMLYMPSWNGLVEGPTWGAWWVQNSYGTTLAALPFYQEPFVTFVQNSQDLWFNKMGDGKTSYVWNGKDSWVPPDGCLMDCANETWAMHRQGDGRVAMHDWGMEFTAAGALLQAELLLISRDGAALAHYLPKLERCAQFIESRRDPQNNLFLAGPAGNLLAPSYAGWKKPDGTYGMAYLAGLSVTHIAFLDRLIELEKLAGRSAQVEQFARLRQTAQAGLARITTPEGYLVKSMDPDGTLHGVFGANRYGYFEASPNHDAICFRVVADEQAQSIYRKLASIPGLRPHGLVVANAPSLDDMYEAPQGLWGFGTWVNGGHWTTCEARMMMAYYRVGAYEDARRSMQQMLKFARAFRMDNPLVEFGNAVYQPNEPVNLTYDAFGAPAGFVRGLFEYIYRADGLTLIPHLPPGVTWLEQKFPVRFGAKKLYLAVAGHGPITKVQVNGRAVKTFEAQSVFLPYDKLPQNAVVQITAGAARARRFAAPRTSMALPPPVEGRRWPEAKPSAVIAATELPLRVGADSDGGSRFVGEIARVAVFSRALTLAELGSLAQEAPGAVWDDASVVGRWSFARAADGSFPNQRGLAGAARAVGPVDTVASPFGPALKLAGQGYLEVSNAPCLQQALGGTWYVLVRPGETKGRLIDKCPVGGATGYTFDTHPGNALRLISDAGTVSADAKLKPGEWVHLAGSVDAEGTSTLYVNGQVVGSVRRTSSPLAVETIMAGVQRARRFYEALRRDGHGETYEAAHARLAVEAFSAARDHQELKLDLPPRTADAARRLYLSTTAKLCEGLGKVLESYSGSPDRNRKLFYQSWREAERP